MARQAERSAATRARVLDAAERLFAEQGYEATSTDEILEASGISRGALYHHFATKQAVFEAVFERVSDADERHKLEQVNTFFNAIPYDTDWDLWDKEDYWATPMEMLGIDGADCEDYAIAKYFTLRELGVAAQRLRITYVKAVDLNQAHMVLAYYPTPSAEPLILDNLQTTIRSAGQRDDLVPVYSFNGEDLWLAKSRHRGVKVGGSGRIKLWNNLRQKMASEGRR